MPQHAKDKYQQTTALELKKIKTRIVELEKEIQKAEADIKVRHDQKMSQIRGHYTQTKEKLDELKQSQQDGWFELKTMLDDAIGLLDEAVEVMSQRISVPSD